MNKNDKQFEILCELTLLRLSENVLKAHFFKEKKRPVSLKLPFHRISSDMGDILVMARLRDGDSEEMLFSAHTINTMRKCMTDDHGFQYDDQPVKMTPRLSEIVEMLLKERPELQNARFSRNWNIPDDRGYQDHEYHIYIEYLLLSHSVCHISHSNGHTYFYTENAYNRKILEELVNKGMLRKLNLKNQKVEFSAKGIRKVRTLKEKYLRGDNLTIRDAVLKQKYPFFCPDLPLSNDAAIEMVLALVYMFSWTETRPATGKKICKSFFNYPYECLEDLQMKLYLNVHLNTNSIILTDKGIKKGRELVRKYFHPNF